MSSLAISAAGKPSGSFSQFDFNPSIVRALADVGFSVPTPIQAEAIPVALTGRDMIGLAQTGTGKTAAFVLPILQRLAAGKPGGIRALVLAPTRELAEQINQVVRELSRGSSIRSVTIYGGVSHNRQLDELSRRPDIVVACPGRLLDHMQGGSIKLNSVETLVLDEADRMFDMGFLPVVRRIVKAVPKERHTMCSPQPCLPKFVNSPVF
jgi:ATP-dependent RNA helicase RhlE